MGNFITDLKRTHYCGNLDISNIDEEVILMGWVHKRRDLGNLIFIDIRDREGIAQIVFNPDIIASIHEEARSLRSEYVIAVRGIVRKRPDNMVNTSLKTGEIEVEVTELSILNESITPPFVLEDFIEVSDNLLLKYRYLDLRRKRLQNNILLRSRVTGAARNFLNNSGFIEIETPFLTKSTPEGARDYLVPSRVSNGMFYALPQSPQLFKQLLMISGFDKYYQIVKCFRDEDLRADRQPEFTQIDIEQSFTTESEIMSTMEDMVSAVFQAGIGIEVMTPFPTITYREAMDRFGKDNPDTRYGLELLNVTKLVESCGFQVFSETARKGGVVKVINVEHGSVFSRKDLDGFSNFVTSFGAKGIIWARVTNEGWTSPIAKYLKRETVDSITNHTNATAGNLLLFMAGDLKTVNDALGNLRTHIAKKLGLTDDKKFSFTWVTEFPLFEYSEAENRLVSTHHPFTAPAEDDVSIILQHPSDLTARAYDLVLNGSEIGGGSIRIHRPEIQDAVFKALKLSENDIKSKFGFFLEALQYGTPPHGGIAFGLDRLLMIMAGADSIRDVIAFPKTQKATCLLTDAPSPVSDEQLSELSLKIV